MRICIVTRKISLSWGGVERVAATVAGRLAKMGHTVQVLTSYSDCSIEGVTIKLLRPSGLISPLKILSFNSLVNKELEEEKFEIVYGLCRVTPPDIYRLSDGIQKYWMEIRYPDRLIRFLKYCTSLVHWTNRLIEEKILLDSSKFLVTNSRFIKEKIMEHYPVPPERIGVIYNGVDHAVFNPGVSAYRKEMRGKYGISDDAFVLLFTANDWERKGLSTVIRAVGKAGINGLRLMVVGRGKKERYLSLARNLNISQETMIFEEHSGNIEKYYGMADAFVLPTRYDPFANVCLEAMACGLPCISTRTNGSSELIEHGVNGFILKDWDDEDRLADQIRQLSAQDLRDRMSSSASETATSYTWERHVEQTLALFKQVAEGKR